MAETRVVLLVGSDPRQVAVVFRDEAAAREWLDGPGEVVTDAHVFTEVVPLVSRRFVLRGLRRGRWA